MKEDLTLCAITTEVGVNISVQIDNSWCMALTFVFHRIERHHEIRKQNIPFIVYLVVKNLK